MKAPLLIALMCMLNAVYVHPLTINRVILGVNDNPEYLDFWPIVAEGWKSLGIQPTLALIAHADTVIDESLGDVIRFEPIPGIPTSFQAQTIRNLLPALFPDDGCLISDMDMIIVDKQFFIDHAAQYPDDAFITYHDGALKHIPHNYPMCYNVARGSTWAELFNIHTMSEITERLKAWYLLGLGWDSDQVILATTLDFWHSAPTRFIKLGYNVEKRIDRANWWYSVEAIQSGYYRDAHLLKPYKDHKREIDALVAHLNTAATQSSPQP